VARVPAWCALEGDAGDVAGVPGGDEDRDGMLGSEAKVMASMAQWIASSSDG
jgi:hypothetical protein